MVRVFYFKDASWEIDFLVNDLFIPVGYDVVFFNEETPMLVDSDDIGNCILVINDSYPFEKIEKMVKRMKPLALFHLSDETGNKTNMLELSKYVKYYVKQYNHRNYRRDLHTNVVQLPCAYAPTSFTGHAMYVASSGTASHIHSSFRNSLDPINDGFIKSVRNRSMDWAFIGTIKADRYEMTERFRAAFPNGKAITGFNNWDATKQIVKPCDMLDIYRDAVFCPVGRGNVVLDCSRIYEAIFCGAIPVIVAEDGEIDSAFWFDGHVPIFVRAKSWDAAIVRCKYLMANPDDLQTIQTKNLDWWKRLINGYRTILRTIKNGVKN